ncbi:MAG: MFS transporter [Clostridia bacterium]
MKNLTSQKKLGKFEMMVFGAGDIFGGGAQLIVNFFYLIFLTDVVKLNPALAGTIVLISRIWDAVSDPMMGLITDNTRSKYGRRRPYILIGSFGIIAAFTMLWWPVGFSSQTATFIYILFAYLFYSTVSTIIMVPYSSMSSEVSMEYKERTVLNGTRLFFSQVSSLLCAVIPMQIVKAAPDVRTGYILLGLVFGIFFAIPLFSIFFVCRERAPMTGTKSKFSFDIFLSPIKIRSFRILIVMYLLAFFSMDVISSIFAYYMKYFLQRPGELDFVLGTMLISQIVFLPIVVKAAVKVGKAQTFMAGAAVWILGAAFLGIYGAEWPAWAIYVIAAVIGAGLSGCIVMAWTMYPDVTDVGELYFNERKSGSFSGIMTFARKSSSALGIFLVSLILEFSGYMKPDTVDGVEVLYAQPDSFIAALRFIVFVIPVVLLAVTILFARKYPLSKQMNDRLRDYLEFKRGKTESTSVTEEELEAMKKELI